MNSPHLPFIITFITIHIKDFLPKIHPLLIKHHLVKKLDEYVEYKMGRKLWLVISLIAIVSLATFIPPALCWSMIVFWGKPVPPFTILTDGDWVAVISVLITTYISGNVWSKHIYSKTQQQDNTLLSPLSPAPPPNQPTTDPDKAALQAALTHNQ